MESAPRPHTAQRHRGLGSRGPNPRRPVDITARCIDLLSERLALVRRQVPTALRGHFTRLPTHSRRSRGHALKITTPGGHLVIACATRRVRYLMDTQRARHASSAHRAQRSVLLHLLLLRRAVRPFARRCHARCQKQNCEPDDKDETKQWHDKD